MIQSHALLIQTLQGACVRRLNGADFTPCDFLPADRSDDFCCPLEQVEGILVPVATLFPSEYIACGIANRTMYNMRSSNWTDEQCLEMKGLIEDQAWDVGKCVCPGSDKLNTSAPSAPPARPSPAPTVPPASGTSLMSMGATVLGFLGFLF